MFSLLGRTPELHIAALGALKAGAVFCPLFSAFGPEPVRARMEIGDAQVLDHDRARFYRRKLRRSARNCRGLKHVILIDGDDDAGQRHP